MAFIQYAMQIIMSFLFIAMIFIMILVPVWQPIVFMKSYQQN